MPIRDEFLYLYQTEEWFAVCAVVDARADGRCENCRCPNGFRITRICGTADREGEGERLMCWRLLRTELADAPWIDQHGNELKGAIPDLWEDGKPAKRKRLLVQLQHAHLNHNPRDQRPENVRLLCRWCHNMHDGRPRAVNAHATRAAKKDAERWVLVAAMEEGP